MASTELDSLKQTIATLKRQNEELLQERTHFAHLLACAPAVTYSFEATGEFKPTFISENVRTLFGYEPKEYLSDPNFVQMRVHPEDAQRIRKEQSKLFELGHLVTEYRFLHKDDRYRWVSDEMRLLCDKNGQPVEVVGTWSDVTKKREITDALVTAQSRLSHVLAASPAVIYSFEAKGEFRPIFVSDNIKEVLGYESREYLEDRKFMPAHIHPEDRTRIDKEWPHLFREGRHVNEYRFRCKRGKYLWVSDHLHLVRDHAGQPAEVVGALIDVSDKKRAEHELLVMKNRLKHLLTAAPAVTYCFNAKGNHEPTFISENVRDLLGYDPRDYLSDRNFVPRHIHPDDAQRVQDDLSHLFEKRYLVHEYRFRRKDGSYCWVNDEMHVVTDENDEPLEVVGSWSDVTARRRMGEAMVAAQNRLNHLLTSAPAVIYSMAASENVVPTFISENVKTLFGYEPNQFLESQEFWLTRIHPDDRASVEDNLRNLFDLEQLTHEYRFLCKDGHYRWVNDELHLLRNSKGSPIEIVGSMHDISARKRIENELAVAKDQAESADRAKSDFLAKMSHELRTPLNAIIGIAEMLIEDAEEARDDPQLEALHRIRRSGGHLLRLINEILDLSKIEAGKVELNIDSFDVKDMVEEVAALVQPLAESRSNQLEVHCSPDIGQMRADQTRLHQTLLNLLSNACKFTENGNIRIDARKEQNGDEANLILSVSDTGIGIAPENLNRLFEQFSQLNSARDQKFGGTGLGLAISRRYCQLMGGDISVESIEGRGSNFTVRLPVNVVAPD